MRRGRFLETWKSAKNMIDSARRGKPLDRKLPGSAKTPARLLGRFGAFFSEKKMSEMAREQRGRGAKNPLDTTALFEKFMGFK